MYHAERESYRMSNFACELCGPLANLGISIPINLRNGIQMHHICGSRFGRKELLTNWICVCPGCHNFCHEQPRAGRIACVWKKLRKKEFDPAEYHSCTGQYVEGTLEIYRDDDLPKGFTGMISDCLLMLKEMTNERD